MKGKIFALAATGVLVLGAAACSQEPAQPAAHEGMAGMEAPATAEAAGAIRSTGMVTAIDPAAGTITLDHQPIPAISWPAMSMQFQAENPAMLQGIAVGDRVAFELKSAPDPFQQRGRISRSRRLSARAVHTKAQSVRRRQRFVAELALASAKSCISYDMRYSLTTTCYPGSADGQG
jgi:Cu(I)/Ag(I) efflux system periplasmic protein CusF